MSCQDGGEVAGGRWWAASMIAGVLLAGGCGGGPVVPSPTTTADVTASAAATPRPAGPTALLAAVPDLHPSVDEYPAGDVVLRVDTRDPGVLVRVRVAGTPERRAHGLMEVTELPAGAGMLFVYTEDHTGAFWMKDTLVPLDIAWIDADGLVVATASMVPCASEPCPTWAPGAAYRQALEVPAGFLAAHGIDVGAIVEVMS